MTDEKFITLNTYLKLKGAADSGGQAKSIIKDGLVKVNGEVETRNKKKLVAGDIVTLGEDSITVESDEIRD